MLLCVFPYHVSCQQLPDAKPATMSHTKTPRKCGSLGSFHQQKACTQTDLNTCIQAGGHAGSKHNMPLPKQTWVRPSVSSRIRKRKKKCPEGERRRGGPQFPRGSMSTGSWSHPANLNTSQLRSSHFCKHSNAVAFPPESCWLSQTPCRCYSPNAPEHQADLHQRTTACTSRNCDCCIPSVLGNNLIYSADNG